MNKFQCCAVSHKWLRLSALSITVTQCVCCFCRELSTLFTHFSLHNRKGTFYLTFKFHLKYEQREVFLLFSLVFVGRLVSGANFVEMRVHAAQRGIDRRQKGGRGNNSHYICVRRQFRDEF